MVSPLLAALAEQTKNTVAGEQSAIVLINGYAAREAAAIEKAMDLGATAEQLKPVQDNLDALLQSQKDLAAAVVAPGTTPAPPVPPVPSVPPAEGGPGSFRAPR